MVLKQKKCRVHKLERDKQTNNYFFKHFSYSFSHIQQYHIQFIISLLAK